MSNLNDVEDAKRALEEAERTYKRTIADAVAGGVPVAKLARVAGVTRKTIYAWLEAMQSDTEQEP